MTTHADIEAQIREIQQRKKDEKQKEDDSDVGLGASGFFDQDIYNGGGKYEGYVTSIAPNDEYDVSGDNTIITTTYYWYTPDSLPKLERQNHRPK